MGALEDLYQQLQGRVPLVTTTGSLPPVTEENGHPILNRQFTDEEARKAIALAVVEQTEAGVDILVPGQIRGTITVIQARDIPGYDGIRIIDKLGIPEESLPLRDAQYALNFARDRGIDKPFKVHITGPTTMAYTSVIETTEYSSEGQFRGLILDLAEALARQAELFARAGFGFIQVDEPVLSRPGADLRLAFEALDIVNARIPVPLIHICRDIRAIFPQLLALNQRMQHPFQVVCIEGKHLMQLPDLRAKDLEDFGVKIAFGCMKVSTEEVEPLYKVERDISIALHRFGEANIWAVTPECGLRRRSLAAARAKMRQLVAARNMVLTKRQQG